ncbi:hypothetical protein BS47DRAFT_1395748 [Hydnum rufescens UP504]|uniref:Uncharacterized protein n=1 Tax=Hydnum rufescens UP504 TaxID=1448309 RepID=A0A9P6ARQ2_9AGAM|nr:hypothetical protein BS47DRAFT_1395748 [Hydnum rufescens UP504]
MDINSIIDPSVLAVLSQDEDLFIVELPILSTSKIVFLDATEIGSWPDPSHLFLGRFNVDVSIPSDGPRTGNWYDIQEVQAKRDSGENQAIPGILASGSKLLKFARSGPLKYGGVLCREGLLPSVVVVLHPSISAHTDFLAASWHVMNCAPPNCSQNDLC